MILHSPVQTAFALWLSFHPINRWRNLFPHPLNPGLVTCFDQQKEVASTSCPQGALQLLLSCSRSLGPLRSPCEAAQAGLPEDEKPEREREAQRKSSSNTHQVNESIIDHPDSTEPRRTAPIWMSDSETDQQKSQLHWAPKTLIQTYKQIKWLLFKATKLWNNR